MQAEFNFKAPAISTLFQNIIIITLVLLFSSSIGIFTIPLGYLFGTAAQFIYLFMGIRKRDKDLFKGINFKLKELGFANSILILTIFVEVINQLYVLIDRYFYGSVDTGGIAALNYAFVLYSLPITLFSIALSTAIFPKFSQSFTSNDHAGLQMQFSNGIKVNLFLFIPITFVFIYFGNPILKLLYQRGLFSENDTYMTFKILRIYSISIIFFSSYAIINKIIYGAGLIKNLLYISIIILVIKIILNILLVAKFKQEGLALSSSICYILLSVSCFLLAVTKLQLKKGLEFLTTILFYSFNGLIAFLILSIIKPFLNYTSLINFVIAISIFSITYILNLTILKPYEYLIFRDILIKAIKK